MNTIQNAAGQSAGAGNRCADFLRALLKRAVMWAYNRELIADACVTAMFTRFYLWSA